MGRSFGEPDRQPKRSAERGPFGVPDFFAVDGAFCGALAKSDNEPERFAEWQSNAEAKRKPDRKPEYFAVSIAEHEPVDEPVDRALRRRHSGW